MDNINLQLRHSELIYLLWLMKTLPLPGIDSKPIDDIYGELTMASLAAAEQSLQERGLIAIQEAGTRIGQHVLILVGSCAMAKATLLVESQHIEAIPENLSFHYHARAWVRHMLLEMGIHRFDLIDSPLDDCTGLIGCSQPPKDGDPRGEFTLPNALLDRIIKLFAWNRLSGLDEILKVSGLSAKTNSAVINTFSDLQQKISIGVTYHYRSQTITAESVVLLRNPRGLWQLENLTGTERVRLVPLTQHEVVEILNRIVRQAQVS